MCSFVNVYFGRRGYKLQGSYRLGRLTDKRHLLVPTYFGLAVDLPRSRRL